MRRLAVCLGLLSMLLLSACASSPAPTAVPATTGPAVDGGARGPYGVSVTQLPLVHGRRALETTVFFPDTDPEVDGPFPLIVFNHGLNGDTSRHTDLAEAWARVGFVVALPLFPLTNSGVASAWENYLDVNNQPGDVSSVLDQLISANDDHRSALFSRIDPERIGVSGHSLGAATTFAVTFDECCLDPRIDAALVMAGVVLVDSSGMDYTTGTPVLIIHGDADRVLPYQSDVDTYAKLSPPKWFVTLLGGTHSPPYEDIESPWDDVVETTSTDFWVGQLDDDPDALARLDADATVPGISSIESDPA